jgi:hypothetical protein
VLGVRLNTMYTALDRLNTQTTEVGSDMDANSYEVLSDGKTVQQKTAGNAMSEMVDLLNTSVAGSYLFGGRRTDEPPVASVDEIMNGSGSRAGFKTVAAQRLAADQGDGLGRMSVSGTIGGFTLAEDGDHPFGMKISTVTNGLSNATLNGPSGTPASFDISFSDQPSAGETFTVTLTLPDGTTTDIKLTAGETNDAKTGEFAIGTTADETAANLQDMLTGQLQTTAKTTLVAASAVAAADGFFSTFNGKAPQRVDGPPYDTATGLVDGTETDTVLWYQGDNSENTTAGWSPRQDVTTNVDTSLAVQYGVRANENAFAEAMARYAAVAVVDVSSDDDTGQGIHTAAMQRAKAGLAAPDDKIQTIELEIVHAQGSVATAKSRHQTLMASYGTTLDSIKNSDDTEVAVKIQALQTRMEASYSATSILYGLSLTKYL